MHRTGVAVVHDFDNAVAILRAMYEGAVVFAHARSLGKRGC